MPVQSLKQSVCFAVAGVVSLPVELTVDEPGSAFFMRPSQPWRSNRSVQEWPMVALAGARTISASYSSAFSYDVQLPASLLRQVAAVRGVAVSSRVIDGFGDVTAHFVTETVSSDRRQLQVHLFDYYCKSLTACTSDVMALKYFKYKVKFKNHYSTNNCCPVLAPGP